MWTVSLSKSSSRASRFNSFVIYSDHGILIMKFCGFFLVFEWKKSLGTTIEVVAT